MGGPQPGGPPDASASNPAGAAAPALPGSRPAGPHPAGRRPTSLWAEQAVVREGEVARLGPPPGLATEGEGEPFGPPNNRIKTGRGPRGIPRGPRFVASLFSLRKSAPHSRHCLRSTVYGALSNQLKAPLGLPLSLRAPGGGLAPRRSAFSHDSLHYQEGLWGTAQQVIPG